MTWWQCTGWNTTTQERNISCSKQVKHKPGEVLQQTTLTASSLFCPAKSTFSLVAGLSFSETGIYFYWTGFQGGKYPLSLNEAWQLQCPLQVYCRPESKSKNYGQQALWAATELSCLEFLKDCCQEPTGLTIWMVLHRFTSLPTTRKYRPCCRIFGNADHTQSSSRPLVQQNINVMTSNVQPEEIIMLAFNNNSSNH